MYSSAQNSINDQDGSKGIDYYAEVTALLSASFLATFKNGVDAITSGGVIDYEKTAEVLLDYTKKSHETIAYFRQVASRSGDAEFVAWCDEAIARYELKIETYQSQHISAHEKLQLFVDDINNGVGRDISSVFGQGATIGRMLPKIDAALTVIDFTSALLARDWGKVGGIACGYVITESLAWIGFRAFSTAVMVSTPIGVSIAVVAAVAGWAAGELLEAHWFDEAFGTSQDETIYRRIESLAAMLASGDRVYIPQSNDVFVFGSNSADVLTASAGSGQNYAAIGLDGNDIIHGNTGNDYLSGGEGDDTLVGNSGDDALNGGNGNDVLNGGLGSDSLSGGAGYDTYSFTSDDLAERITFDQILDSDGQGVIRFNGIDITGTGIGFDNIRESTLGAWETANGEFRLVVIGAGTSTQSLLLIRRLPDGTAGGRIHIRGWSNGDLGITLPGFDDNTPATGAQQSALDDLFGDGLDNSGNNSINALDGNDGLSGSSGDDSLDGGAGDDLIFGGHGNDKLYGGDGNDFLLDGTERVEFREWDDEHPFDEFGGKTTKQYHEDEIARLGSAIIMRGKSWYVYDNGDGTTIAVGLTDMGSSQYEPLDPNLYPSGDDIIDGGAGNDTVYAGEGDDIIIGGTGQDKLYGGHDNDIINGGDGDDTIFGDAHESGVPGVHFTYLVSDAAVRNGSDVIDAGAGNDCVTGGGGNDVIYGGSGNDTLLGRGESRAVDSDDADADYIDGGDGDDVITGDDGDDTLLGGDGADEIRGDQETAQTRSGNDYIDGGNGDDILHGDGGNDTVLGGAGADHIQGDSLDLAGDRHGNDMLSGGDGNDIVAGLGGNDVLMGDDGDDQLMGDAAESDLALAYHGNDQLFGGAGNDLLWGGGGSDTLDGGTGNDQLDGGQGDDALSGGEGDDQLLGGVGNDTLSGGAGDDTLVAGDGNDSLSGGAGVDVLDAGAGNDTLDGGSGNDTLDGDEGDDTLYGGEGADALYGGFGSDVLSGGAGNDTLAGAQGNDRYLFNLDWGMDTIQGMAAADAGHDVIEFGAGISAEDLDVAIDVAGNLTLTLVGGTDQLTLMGFLGNAGHRIEFFDGTVWTQESMFANLAASSGGLIGDSGNNLIVAEQTIDPNVIYGGLGDDLVIGGSGSDTIFGGQGDAEIGSPVSPDDDRIFGGAGSDTIYAESGNDLVDAGSGNDAVYGGDGSDRLYGGEGDDVLNAGGSRTVSGIVFHETADDLVVGGEGNDVLGAGLGTNTYHFDAGFGQDTIYLTQASAYEVSQMGLGSESAILRFGAGISAAGIVLMRNGNEVVVQHGADQITISGYGGSTGTSIDFVFEDGTTLSAQQLEVLTRIVGSPVGETLSGTNSDDVLDGSGGDDTLVGNAGNDILIGGAGRDILNGGAGDDTYRYGLNDGIDTLYWGNVSGHDLLELGAGILPGEVTFHKETHANGNATLYMLIDATGNYIKLNITAGQSDQTVDLIRFADGTTMTIAEADAASVPMWA